MDPDEKLSQDFLLKDLLDISAFTDLSESFSQLTGLPTAILDLSGKILVASGWQRICTQFHRKNPTTASRCLESDTVLASKLAKGEKYNVYKCRNGLVDVAVPIIVDGKHMGNLFAGQFLLESPDMDYFARQAEAFGFHKTSYMKALSEVPVLSTAKIKQAMDFLTHLTAIITTIAIDKKKLFDLNTHLDLRIQDRTAELELEIHHRKRSEAERERLISELKEALAKVKKLSGLLPICSFCKKIRDDRGYWNQIEAYIKDHSEAEFSHSICQECAKKHYPELYNDDS